MSKFLPFSLFLISFLLILPAQADSPPPSDLLLIGDSLAYQLAHALKNEGKDRNVSVAAQGIGGSNTSQWVRRHWAEHACQEHPARLVLVSLGTNDSVIVKIKARQMFPNKKKHTSLDLQMAWTQMAQDLIDVIGESCYKAKIVWLLPPRMPFNLDFVRRGILHTDIDYVFDSAKLDLFKQNDGVHLTWKANVIWADAILDFTRPLLAPGVHQ